MRSGAGVGGGGRVKLPIRPLSLHTQVFSTFQPPCTPVLPNSPECKEPCPFLLETSPACSQPSKRPVPGEDCLQGHSDHPPQVLRRN